MASVLPERKTTCAYCGVGCGVAATIRNADDRAIVIQGDVTHPANHGRLCSKGTALGETLSLQNRMLWPSIGGQRVFWGEALDNIAATLTRIRTESGPEAIAFYVSGQLLTEDYYVANKFAKGFIGTANIDTNSRLCMASTVAAHKRAFGADTVPGCYEDLELADLVVLVGSNTAWCHPVLFQRLKAARDTRGTKIVVIDPRRTMTCEIADLHLAIKPGSDTALFNGLLDYLATQGHINTEWITAHTQDFAQALHSARTDVSSLAAAAARTGVNEATLLQFFSLFAAHEQTVTAWSQGSNQSSHGTDNVNSIINCHLATGRIGKPGMGPLSLTGQPNAMGGREVGGLANQLAAHMDFSTANCERVARFWHSPLRADNTPLLAQTPGLKAVSLFDALHAGKIRFLWVIGTNPAVSLPDVTRVREALARCEYLVVSDCVADTDTTRLAHVALPALAWGEKDGTVTNSERRISRQCALLPPPGEARADWWAVAQVAQRLGYREQFAYEYPHEIWNEHAALSGFENDAGHGQRAFNVSALANLARDDYDTLLPTQWPVTSTQPRGVTRLYSDGVFFHQDQRARFIAIGSCTVAQATTAAFPFALNTGRLRDQWHTMTRTGEIPRLNRHYAEPLLEMHPQDVQALSLQHGGFAEVHSLQGTARLRVSATDAVACGNVFVPMHWTGVLTRSGSIGAVINAEVDSVSGQPEFKHTPVNITAWHPALEGVLLTREPLSLPALDYAVRVRERACYRVQFAVKEKPSSSLASWLRTLLPTDISGEWQQVDDAAQTHAVLACLRDGVLLAIAMVETGKQPQRIDWLCEQFASLAVDDTTRRWLTAMQLPPGISEPGRTLCACMQVAERTLYDAAREGCNEAAELCARTGAGTRCGTCLPEIHQWWRANNNIPINKHHA